MSKIYIKNLNKEINLSPIISIFNNLNESGIILTNKCGGKGLCGLCKIKINNYNEKYITKPNEKEKKHLIEDEFKNGLRLACQTFSLKDIEIEYFSAKISKFFDNK